jgi:hypothetical protein
MFSIKVKFSVELYLYFDSVERERLMLCMLGHVDDVIQMLIPIDKYAEFMNLNATFLKAIYAYL